MNREIKFRGLRVDGGGLVYGYYWFDIQNKKHKITVDLQDDNFMCHEVNPDSIGQFTGLKDKNGVYIYEGDIVKYKTTVKTDEIGRNIKYFGEIQFWTRQSGCGWRYKSGRFTMMIKYSHAFNMEVIGNIHEN